MHPTEWIGWMRSSFVTVCKNVTKHIASDASDRLRLVNDALTKDAGWYIRWMKSMHRISEGMSCILGMCSTIGHRLTLESFLLHDSIGRRIVACRVPNPRLPKMGIGNRAEFQTPETRFCSENGVSCPLSCLLRLHPTGG